jgi:hypothetical protein
MAKDGLIKTGIKGLDSILLGGIPRNQCDPGSGREWKRKDPNGRRSLSIVGSPYITSLG